MPTRPTSFAANTVMDQVIGQVRQKAERFKTTASGQSLRYELRLENGHVFADWYEIHDDAHVASVGTRINSK